MNLEVVLINDNGVLVAQGICRKTHPQDCVDKNTFGIEDVGLVILEALVHSKVNPIHRFSLHRYSFYSIMSY